MRLLVFTYTTASLGRLILVTYSMSHQQQKRKLDPTPAEVKRVRVSKPGPRSGFRLAASSSNQPAPRTTSIVTLKDNTGHRTGQRRVENKSSQQTQLDDRSKQPETSGQFQGPDDEQSDNQGMAFFDSGSVSESVSKAGRQKNGQKRTYENLVRLSLVTLPEI
jgi:hypothetical protein